jgi:hypothetical protein
MESPLVKSFPSRGSFEFWFPCLLC